MTSVSPTKFERYLKMDRQALVNPFKPADRGTKARSSLATLVKSSKHYAERADTNRSKGTHSFLAPG